MAVDSTDWIQDSEILIFFYLIPDFLDFRVPNFKASVLHRSNFDSWLNLIRDHLIRIVDYGLPFIALEDIDIEFR